MCVNDGAMKPRALLLGASLVINTALLATLVLKPEMAPLALRSLLRHGHASHPDESPQTSAMGGVDHAGRGGNPPIKSHWQAMDTADLKVLVARLREAGYPPLIIRAIIAVRVDEVFRSRSEAILAKAGPKEYWKPRQLGPETLSERQALNRERTRLIRSLVADELAASPEVSVQRRREYGSLPGAKIELVQRIEEDYSDMEGELSASFQNVFLPEDREKLALLQREKRADLAQVLSPEELAEYELRSSRVTQELRPALTLMNASEAEFRAIHAAYQPHVDALYPTEFSVIDAGRRRQETLERVLAAVKQALGPDRAAEFERASDREFQQMRRLTVQANLPLENALQAYALRGRIAAESERIAEAKDMGDEQKRAALKTLAQNARVQLNALLGQDSYANSVVWLNAMERGASVRFAPAGGVSLRPVGMGRPPRS